MYPVLLRAGRMTVYSYTAIVILSLLAALTLLAWQDRRDGGRRLDAALFALVLALIGARLAYVLANWSYYVERMGETLALTRGGLSLHGGLMAGMLGLLLFARYQDCGRQLFWLARELLPALAIGLVGGWLACLFAGCAYGIAVPPPQRFYTPDWPDLYGVYAFRWPSQVLGLLLALGLLLWIGRRPGATQETDRSARQVGVFLVVYGLGDFLIAFVRGDHQLIWGPLWAAQWADLALLLVGLSFVVFSEVSKRRKRYVEVPGGSLSPSQTGTQGSFED